MGRLATAGREGVERFVADTSENWEDLQGVAEEFRDLGDRVLTLGRLKGRGKGSGAPGRPAVRGNPRLSRDRIWRFRAVLRSRRGLRAAGLSE